MKGLTLEGLRGKIKDDRFVLTENEAIDLFFLLPELVELKWEKDSVTETKVRGLNLTFSTKN